MEKVKIPKIRVEARNEPGDPYTRVRARQVEYEVTELPEHGGRGDRLTPLEAFLAGLASCEAIMFRMIQSQLSPQHEPKVSVDAEAEFEMGQGIKSLKVKYRVEGMPPEEARRIIELVKTSCPVYNTLNKTLDKIEEELDLRP